ncbi:MAG: repeat-containing protein [Verrucomicrobia bacterium]|nr:repeat-containing protein [Verrucomicrobiota bacterium]
MKLSSRPIITFASIGLLAFALAGCTPAAKKARYLADGDRHFAEGKYDEAEIDYKNALQIENVNPHAIEKLGMIYFDQGRLGRSFAFIQKSTELQPNNLEDRVKLGQLYFAFGQIPEARDQASYVLERQPENPQAVLLMADAARNAKDMEVARARLKALPAPASQSAAVSLALGIFELRERHFKEAQDLFERAISLDPKSIEAHTALAGLYRLQNNVPGAEKEYKAAADLAPMRSPRRLQYAQFKVQTGDYAGARKMLEDMIRQTPDYLPGVIVLAQISAVEKKLDEAAALIAKVLARDPLQPEAMLLSGRIELARGNPTKAASDTLKMIHSYPRAAQAHQQLALAYLDLNDLDKAEASLTQAVNISPNYTDASVLLARLANRKGDYSSTVLSMKQVIQQKPDLIEAWLLLGDAYRGQGNLNDALSVYREMAKHFPKAPQAPFLMGMIYLMQNKRAEAREAFDQTLALAPEYPPAVEQLVGLDVAEKNLPAAIQHTEALIARNPKAAGPHLLLARVFIVQKDSGKAEVELRKAIELQPDAPASYYMLASLYFDTNQNQKALDNISDLLAKNPKDAQGWMLRGVLYDQMKDFPKARESYEKVLAINPNFTAALNNVAYLYSEKFNEFDKAEDAAAKARELLPQEPHTADTYGWVLYRKHQYARALPLLAESAGKLPDSAEVQYHLGMVQYMLGDETAARGSLQRALGLNQPFTGTADAKLSLELLSADSSTASRASLEKAVADRPDDMAALTRLAAVYEKEGALDKAIATNQAILKNRPNSVRPMLSLVRLYAAQKDMGKALEMAKAARKANPVDADIAYALGRLAYQSNDYPWAASLLQEAERKSPDDPEIQFDYALAVYSIGRVDDANEALNAALGSKTAFSRGDQAKKLQDLIALSATPSPANAGKIDVALKADPSNVPALMGLAAIDEQKGDFNGAKDAYEKALAKYPDFTPAKRGLAIYYASNPSDDAKAYDLATKARDAFPDDPSVAKALGIISYRRGDTLRASNLLGESASKKADDPETLFYLGMTQVRLKNTPAAKQSLQRALELGLKGDNAVQAKKALAGIK